MIDVRPHEFTRCEPETAIYWYRIGRATSVRWARLRCVFCREVERHKNHELPIDPDE